MRQVKLIIRKQSMDITVHKTDHRMVVHVWYDSTTCRITDRDVFLRFFHIFVKRLLQNLAVRFGLIIMPPSTPPWLFVRMDCRHFTRISLLTKHFIGATFVVQRRLPLSFSGYGDGKPIGLEYMIGASYTYNVTIKVDMSRPGRLRA